MSKDNLMKSQDLLYSNLVKNLEKKETIRINREYVPKNLNNNSIRFFNNNSIWFSKLENSNEILFYFGLMDNTNDSNSNIDNPLLMLKFNNDLKKSNVRIQKNFLLIIVELPKNQKECKNTKFKLINATKNKKSNKFFLVLGKINSKKIISKINDLLNEFTFNLNIKENILKVEDNTVNDSSYFSINIAESSDMKDNLNDYSSKKVNIIENNSKENIKNIKNKYNSLFNIDDNTKIILNEMHLPEEEIRIDSDFDRINFNINVFNLINKIKSIKMDFDLENTFINYLFIEKDNGDFEFSENVLNQFNDKHIDENYIFSILDKLLDYDCANLEEYKSKLNSFLNFKS